MFKITILSLAFISAVLAETSFEHSTFKSHQYSTIKPGYEVSKPEGALATAFYIPPDNGGNFGDNLWKNRVPGDKLISTEIQINGLSSQEQQFNWKANFPGKSITHIRFLNIGRQRAFVESITSSGGPTATAVIKISPNQQFRLLIEIYAR